MDEPLTIKSANNSDQLDTVVNSARSAHFGIAYYLKPYLQLGINSSFTILEDNTGDTNGDFEDIQLRAKIRLYSARRSAFSLLPIVTIPLEGGETLIQTSDNPPVVFGTNNLLSNDGLGVGLFAIYEYLFRYFQISFNLGYQFNADAEFIDNSGITQIDRTQLITAGFGLYYPFHDRIGLNIELLSNFTQPFFNDDINPTEFFVGLSGTLSRNVHAFGGVGVGNFFSSDDGNDFRIVGGIKYIPRKKQPKEKVATLIPHNLNKKPTRIIEDYNGDRCKEAFLFDASNAMTILFKNDSSQISEVQKNKLSKVFDLYHLRKEDIKSIEVFGHTSLKGSEEYNMKLGARRAEGIRSLMIEAGIDKNQIETMVSYGESTPLEKTGKVIDEKINRRVEVYFNLTDDFGACYEK